MCFIDSAAIGKVWELQANPIAGKERTTRDWQTSSEKRAAN
jgi:hypothetical protein